MKNVYIIIVTYNAMKWLNQCLESCSNYNVIVVDNASTDETLTFISSNYPDIIQLPQKENLGFGKGNNIGISHALKEFSAEHVFLLNQDAYLVDNVLEDLVKKHKAKHEYGILSPIHVTSGKDKMDKKFSEYLGVDNESDLPKTALNYIYDVPFVNAAGWLMSKECLLNVGGFDPIFFLYGEDNNLCQRVMYHGYKIGVVLKTYIIHDRENRQQEFSQERKDKIQANIYKVEFANINNSKALQEFSSRANYLKRQCLKMALSFNFKELANQYKKYRLLIKNKESIKLSYKNNQIKAPHYLQLNK